MELVRVVLVGNATVPVQPSIPEEAAAPSAPCADSRLTVKERISMLDEMALNDDNEDEIPASDDDESLA